MNDDQPTPDRTDDEAFVAAAMQAGPEVTSEAVRRLVRGALTVGRASLARRRRRAVVSSGLAVAMVAVGAVAGVRAVTESGAGSVPHAGHQPSSRPGSSQPTGHPGKSQDTPSSLWAPGATLDWVVFTGDRASVASWKLPSPAPRLSAWTRTGDGWGTAQVIHVLNGPEGSQSTAGDAVLFSSPYRARFLEPDGSTTPIQVRPDAAPATPGQALFGDPFGGWMLFAFDQASRMAHPVPLPPGVMAFAAAWDNDGRLWIEGWGDGNQRVAVAWSSNGGATWTRRLVSGGYGYPGGLAVGPGGKVAAFAWRDPSDQTSIITYDSGSSWHPLDRGPGPSHVNYQGYAGGPGAVTTMGNRLFVVDSETQQLWTATGTWQNLRRLQTPLPVVSVQTNGRLLWAISGVEGGGRGPRLLMSSDQGATWRIVTPR